MTKITKEEVKKVAHLARLELNENEINNHAEQLEKILDYIKQLEKIDTEDVQCTTRAIEVINVLLTIFNKNFFILKPGYKFMIFLIFPLFLL